MNEAPSRYSVNHAMKAPPPPAHVMDLNTKAWYFSGEGGRIKLIVLRVPYRAPLTLNNFSVVNKKMN